MNSDSDIKKGRQLTEQFYEWEARGRGWLLADELVQLESPFHPFFFHFVPTSYIDDGKQHTVFSKALDFLKGGTKEPIIESYKTPPIDPFIYEDEQPLTLLQIAFPRGYKVRAEMMEQFFVMLSFCTEQPISFEIVATHTNIQVQLVLREVDEHYIKSQLKAYFPECNVQDKSETLFDLFSDELSFYIVDFGLKEEFMRPLSLVTSYDHDPYMSLFAILDALRQDERIIIQLLFNGTQNPWTPSILNSVSDGRNGSFFIDAPDMLALAQEKVSKPLCAVTARIVTQSESVEHAAVLLERAATLFTHLSASKYNSLLPLSDSAYDVNTRIEDVLLRVSHRVGMLLNVRELATLAHFPSASITSEKLVRDIQKTKAAPANTEGQAYMLGINSHQGIDRIVSLSAEQRLRHMHIIGATGTGKSTLLLNLINQDIHHKEGFCVLDPHGDLIETILTLIPANRVNDVVLIDPFDSEYPVAFNILHAHSDIEKEILSSDLVALFKRFSTSWGDQMNSVFANAILAFLESTTGGTLVDLRRFLIEKDFREKFLKTVTDQNVVYYWQKEFPILKSNSIGPILTRLDSFLRPKLIRNMVSDKQSLDFEHLMDSKKIILVKLSQGLIGAENSFLLGAFIVSKIQQAAMARQAKHQAARNNFWLYIDEFGSFVTPSMAMILSGARKYHLGLVLAHQDMHQIIKYDSELSNAILANAGTRICFRLGDTDAKRLQDGFSYFDASDLQNLPIGHTINRANRTEQDFSMQVLPLQRINATDYTQTIIDRSREMYAIQKLIMEDIPFESVEDVTDVSKEPKEKAPAESHTYISYEPVNDKQNEDSPIENKKKENKPLINKPPAKKESKKSSGDDDAVLKKAETEHRYMQLLIKKMAEARGYKAALEVPTANGGKVDVALEKDNIKIACEVSVTTDATWELHNIEKCLQAGYSTVIVCSKEQKSIEAIKQKIKASLSSLLQSRVQVLQPEELFQYLDSKTIDKTPKETTIKGYRVKVKYENGGESQNSGRAKAVLSSFKKASSIK